MPLTIKYLVRLLHIHRPTFHVMCILGKPYPSDAFEFIKAGLGGDWDPKMAGQRMKLPTPLTWETELSKGGNTAESWRKLILTGKLPYMAMLRNLRNIIKSGVSEIVHRAVINKLTNSRSVIASKQFPFRFFAAYSVLDELDRKLQYNHFLYRLFRKKNRVVRQRLQRKMSKVNECLLRPCKYTPSTLEGYKKALETAIEISIRNNLPPIRGKTLIICSVPMVSKRHAKPVRFGDDLRVISVLLGLMCARVCEAKTVYLAGGSSNHLIPLESFLSNRAAGTSKPSENLLESVHRINYSLSPSVEEGLPVQQVVQNFYTVRQQFDTVFVAGPMLPEVVDYVSNCGRHWGRVNAVWNDLSGHGTGKLESKSMKDWVIMRGTTDIVLRYLAEASDAGLLERVERIDELYDLDRPVRVHIPTMESQQTEASVVSESIERPISEWRCCRVFISSTFRDMHAERDLICGTILPSVRTYAARELRVHVNEVDLRWGVPEPVTRSPLALQMCLEQVADTDILVLLVGNRYGWVPKRGQINSLPAPVLNHLNKFYISGMSVTEMEYHTVKQAILRRVPAHLRRSSSREVNETLRQHVIAFIRDPAALREIPETYITDFEEQNEAKRQRLESFKQILKDDGVVVCDKYSSSQICLTSLLSYPAWFDGLIADRPVMTNLGKLGHELTDSLHQALNTLFKHSASSFLEMRTLQLPRRATDYRTFLYTFVEPIACAISPRQLLQAERAILEMDSRGKQCHTIRLLAAQRVTSSSSSTQRAPLSHSLGDNTRIFHNAISVFFFRLCVSASDGTILLVTGSPGCGKTTHLAALTMSLSFPGWFPKLPTNQSSFDVPDPREKLLLQTKTRSTTSYEPNYNLQRPRLPFFYVIPHFVDGLSATGLTPKNRLTALLDAWVERLLLDAERAAASSLHVSKRLKQIKEGLSESPSSQGAASDAMLHRLLSLLSSFAGARYAFVLDSADHLQPAILDWLPEKLPENVRFVISCDANSTIARDLASRTDCLALTISGLNVSERAAAVRTLFGQYGKVLNESAFGNQLSLLVNNRGAEIPLFLRLACDELRLYGTYENLDAQLKQLPDSIAKLVHHVVARVEAMCGSQLTLTALSFICASPRPLAGNELHTLLDAWLLNSQATDESKRDPVDSSWLELDVEFVTMEDMEFWFSFEQKVYALLTGSNEVNKLVTNKTRVHLPALAFHILLNGLRPLLAGFGDEGDAECDTSSTECNSTSLDLRKLPKGWIRFRSQEIANIVQDIVCGRTAGLTSFARLGFHQPAVVGASFHQWKRTRVDGVDKFVKGGRSVDQVYIHWLLATRLSDLEHKLFHFFHADKMRIVCHLLISGTFLSAKFRAGFGSSILENFQGYECGNYDLQAKWKETYQNPSISAYLSSVRKFIAVHSGILSKYPFLISQLAINDTSNAWIRKWGCVQLALHQSLITPIVAAVNHGSSSSRVRTFVCRSLPSTMDQSTGIVSPSAVYTPLNQTGPGSRSNVPTAIACSPNGQLLVIGTSFGTVSVMELATLRELRSLFGHRNSVLSLCFLPTAQLGLHNIGEASGCWLASTAEDGSLFLWNISASVDSSGRLQLSNCSRLISLTGPPHRGAVTSCAWHPDRRLLATGGLDRSVVLWTLPVTARELSESWTHDTRRPLLNFDVVRTGSACVSSVAFRLPTLSMVNATGAAALRPCDVLAIGCWDGSVRIYDLYTSRYIKILPASMSAICSVAYSPDGGSTLATQDCRGQLFLWNSENYALLGGITSISVEATPANTFSKLLECYRGHVYFSRPRGRYLVQSGGILQKTGEITAWNSQLGASLGPWRTPAAWRPGSFSHVSVFTTDPLLGRLAVVGSNEGAVGFVCMRTGQLLQTVQCGRSRVQAVACSVITVAPTKLTLSCRMLVIVGSSSGLIRTYSFLASCPLSATDGSMSEGMAEGKCQLSELVSVLPAGDDSDSLLGEAVARDGGVLCVSADHLVTVSGNGDASFEVHFYRYENNQVRCPNRVHVPSLGAAVTAVALRKPLLAVGTTSRAINIYRIDWEACTVSALTQIHHAANDWITALSWGTLVGMMARTACALFVGSNDQLLRVYRYSESVVTGPMQTLDGPGGSITSLSVEGRYVAAGSAEGAVKVWRNNVANTLDSVTVLDLVADYRSNGVVDTDGTRVISVNLSIDSPDYTRALRKNSLIDLNLTDQVSAGDTNTETFLAVDVETSDVQAEEAFSEDLAESIQPSSPSLVCTDNYEHNETELSVSDTEAYWHFMSKPDRPQSVQKSCLLQSGLGHDQARLQAQDSAQLRLTVSQQLPAETYKEGFFRFRTFAPLLPECRAVLTGHSGLVACGLAGDNMDDSTVVSVAGQSASDGGNKLGACDIRFWNLPADDTMPCCPSSHHEGSITCLSRIHSPTTGDWCLSGGMDSKLIFWRPCTRTPAFPVHHPLAMLNSLERDEWIPTFQVLFARDQQPIFPITAVLTSGSSDLHRVFLSAGREVWSIEIPDKALTLFTQQGSLSVEKLAEWSHCHTNSDLLKVESTFLDQAVIDLCPSILADNVQIDLFASLSDMQFPLVPLSSQSGKFERVSSGETIEFHLADPVPE
ncbi:telomerase protein component 1 [Paragonimus westermani]|uniref:Telomerase protein component 1 n=1 Tax=Paragonimus westermani TaxID=34504 RepID=A0A5J4P042_9TREM|nr:telomerase protein component 1 [Paragonimus westermani]